MQRNQSGNGSGFPLQKHPFTCLTDLLIHLPCLKSTTSNIPHIVLVALTTILTEDIKTRYIKKKNLTPLAISSITLCII